MFSEFVLISNINLKLIIVNNSLFCVRLREGLIDKDEERIKGIAFEIAKQYKKSFTPYKKNQISLGSRDKGTKGKI